MIIAETERLLVRPWTLEDAEDAFNIYRHTEVTDWLLAHPSPSIEAQREALANRIKLIEETYQWEFGYYAMQLKETGRVIGAIILKPLPGDERVEIGWHLGPSAWGKGYATEAAKAMLEYGFHNRGLDTIYAITLPNNTRSQAVCKRLGMVYEGETDRYHNLVLSFFSLSKIDWEAQSSI